MGPERTEVCYSCLLQVASCPILSPMPDRPILLIQCPSCLHENSPGEHFCAVCGVPLHLKPCPACGKVDEAAAKTCSACGATFPALAQNQYVPADDVRPPPSDSVARASEPSSTPSPVTGPAIPPASANRAWPLIIVALVAGGIPFLWMYRANMPLPKAWQVPGQNAAGSAVAPAPLPSVAVPPLAPAVAGDTPSAKATPAATAVPADEAKTAQPGTVVATRRPNAKPVAKPAAKPVPVGQTGQPGPCTEGLAALDLCDPNRQSAGK